MVNRSDTSLALRAAATRCGRCAVVTALLALVACSGGDGAGVGTTLPSPTSASVIATTEPSVPATTAPAVPQTSAPPTVAPEPTGSVPPATFAPGMTEEQAKQAVIEAAIASWTALNEVLLDPTNDDLIGALAKTRKGEILDRAIEAVAGYRARNEAERTHPEFPATIRVRENTVRIDLVSGTAEVEYCRLNSNIWVVVGAEADGSDRVLNDEVNSYLESATFEMVDGTWLKTRATEISIYEGEPTCPVE